MKKSKPEYHAAGGAVRDLLLGRAHHDVDYVFAGSQTAFIQSNPQARKVQNNTTCLYILNGQEYAILETAPDREEEALAADLARRDFTINALLLSGQGVIHSHPQAFSDLTHRILRPASPTALESDPVRALRAARFSAELPDFSLHSDCYEQMRTTSARELLADIAPEQAGRECLKACMGALPGNFLRSLRRGGCLAPWFEEFSKGGALPAGPPVFHDTDVLEHTARVMDAVAGQAKSAGARLAGKNLRLAVWMALCHDIGKTTTPHNVLPRHIGHEQRGAALAAELGERLRLPTLFTKAGALAAELHMKAANYPLLRPNTKLTLLLRVSEAHIAEPFFALVAADTQNQELPPRMRHDLERILGVKLPLEWQSKGQFSGEHLRMLRCRVLANRPEAEKN